MCAIVSIVPSMDYGALSIILMFDECDTQLCVNISIVDDLVLETTETVYVTLNRTADLDARIQLEPVDAEIQIVDDDGTYISLV